MKDLETRGSHVHLGDGIHSAVLDRELALIVSCPLTREICVACEDGPLRPSELRDISRGARSIHLGKPL